jgi:tetratricopeptide (TPR) repeat protein
MSLDKIKFKPNITNADKISDYQNILSMIYRGLYEEAAAEIRILRSQNSMLWSPELSLMQQLLAARIALKSGFIPENVEEIQISHQTSAFLAGEIFIVKGIVHYQVGKMAEGIVAYGEAQKYFAKTEYKDKELICYYNVLIGESHLSKKILSDELYEFRQLQIVAEKYLQNKILGLVYRQKSYLYKEHNKLNAALAEAEKSIPFLELYCAVSDFHLGLLNIVEILIELNAQNEAHKYYEMLIEPFDKRVQFPKAFIESRLFNQPIATVNNEQSCPHFLQRFQLWNSKVNNTNPTSSEDPSNQNSLIVSQPIDKIEIQNEGQKIHILFNNKKISLKRNCLETKLIETLQKGPQTKNLICEKLWPAYSETYHLDNRLHRLISRINKKINGLILYSARTYRLCGN